MPMNKLLSFFFFFLLQGQLCCSASPGKPPPTHMSSHKLTHTNAVPHTHTHTAVNHGHLTNTCITANVFLHRIASYESMLMHLQHILHNFTHAISVQPQRRNTFVDKHSHILSFLLAQCVIMNTELYKGHLYSESLDLCMWEAVCCGRGGGSRVNTALREYTEITAE